MSEIHSESPESKIDRREFIEEAGAAVGGAMMSPSIAEIFAGEERSDDTAPDMNDHNITGEQKEVPIYTHKDVRAHVECGAFEWKEASDLLKDTPEECVDGRCACRPVIGMPGGNAGELALMLAAAEKTAGREFTEREIEDAFGRFLDHVGSFYLHTDRHAILHLQDAICEDARFVGLTGGKETADQLHLRGPKASTLATVTKEEVEQHLLEHLTNPENIGCGHLKYMIKEEIAYGLRSQIVKGMLRAFFKRLWKGDERLEYFPVDQDNGKDGRKHEERAVLIVKTTEENIGPDTKIPIFRPCTKKGQAFVYHPQAAAFLRKEISQHMPEISGITDLDLDAYNRNIEQLGNQQLQATLQRLAKGKPIYTLTFQPDGEFTIEGGDKIE